MKKILVTLLTCILTISNCLPVLAAEQEITGSESTTAQVGVNIDIKSFFSVGIPTETIIDTSTGQGEYAITVKGELDPNKQLVVRPEDGYTEEQGDTSGTLNFYLKDVSNTSELGFKKDDILVTMNPEKTVFQYTDVQKDASTAYYTYLQSNSAVSAGKWENTIKYHITYMDAYTPGLYTDNTYTVLVKSWDEMIESGLLTVNNGVLDLAGDCIYDMFDDSARHENADVMQGTLVVDPAVTAIGEYAFMGCDLLTEVLLPSTVQLIQDEAFGICSNLRHIYLPKTLQSIEEEAFYNCYSLFLVIPEQVQSIGYNAFYNVPSVNYAGVAEDEYSDNWGALNRNGYTEGNFLYEDSTKTCLLKYVGTENTVTIPDGVESIENGAFNYCYGIKTVILPETLTSYGDSAFVVQPSYSAISGIPNAIFLTPPIGPISNMGGAQCFNGYVEGDFIYTDESKTTLASYVGSDKNVEVPAGVTTIKSYAFSNGPMNYIDNLTVPDTVTSVGNKAFNKVCNVIWEGDKLGEYGQDYDNCYIEGDFVLDLSKTVVEGYLGDDTNVVIPNGVTTIGEYAFEEYDEIETVVIPEGVTLIEYEAFYDCDSLRSVTLPDGLLEIGESAFEYCTSLRNVTLPDGLLEIGSNAFDDCDMLRHLDVPESVESIGTYAFDGIKHITYNGTAEDENGNNWGAVYRNKYVDGDFVYEDDTKEVLLAYIGTDDFVTVPDTVSEICSDAFNGQMQVTVPNSVTVIESDAFYDVLNVIYNGPAEDEYDDNWGAVYRNEVITVENNFILLGNDKSILYAYNGSESTVVVPEGVKIIGINAFSYNDNLRKVVLPDSVIEIRNLAFYDCDYLESINLPNGLQYIGQGAFYWNSNISNLIIPSSVTYIGNNAFYRVPHITYNGSYTTNAPWGAYSMN